MPDYQPSRSSKPNDPRFLEEESFYYALLAEDPKAWEMLYRKVSDSFIPQTLSKSALSTDDAYDLLQEGLSICIVNLRDGKFVFQGKSIVAYASAICHRQWLTRLRKNKSVHLKSYQEPSAEEEEMVIDLIDEHEYDEHHSEPEIADVQSIWGDEEQDADYEALERARKEIGRNCQLLMDYFYVQEKSLAECGQLLGIQEGSAKVKRFRCFQRLKDLYFMYRKK